MVVVLTNCEYYDYLDYLSTFDMRILGLLE